MKFTCPHCGKATDSADSGFAEEALERIGEDLFPPIPLGAERSIDERLCCQDCFARADDRRRDETGKKIGPHRYSNEYHQLNRLANAVGTRRP